MKLLYLRYLTGLYALWFLAPLTRALPRTSAPLQVLALHAGFAALLWFAIRPPRSKASRIVGHAMQICSVVAALAFIAKAAGNGFVSLHTMLFFSAPVIWLLLCRLADTAAENETALPAQGNSILRWLSVAYCLPFLGYYTLSMTLVGWSLRYSQNNTPLDNIVMLTPYLGYGSLLYSALMPPRSALGWKTGLVLQTIHAIGLVVLLLAHFEPKALPVIFYMAGTPLLWWLIAGRSLPPLHTEAIHS